MHSNFEILWWVVEICCILIRSFLFRSVTLSRPNKAGLNVHLYLHRMVYGCKLAGAVYYDTPRQSKC